MERNQSGQYLYEGKVPRLGSDPSHIKFNLTSTYDLHRALAEFARILYTNVPDRSPATALVTRPEGMFVIEDQKTVLRETISIKDGLLHTEGGLCRQFPERIYDTGQNLVIDFSLPGRLSYNPVSFDKTHRKFRFGAESEPVEEISSFSAPNLIQMQNHPPLVEESLLSPNEDPIENGVDVKKFLEKKEAEGMDLSGSMLSLWNEISSTASGSDSQGGVSLSKASTKTIFEKMQILHEDSQTVKGEVETLKGRDKKKGEQITHLEEELSEVKKMVEELQREKEVSANTKTRVIKAPPPKPKNQTQTSETVPMSTLGFASDSGSGSGPPSQSREGRMEIEHPNTPLQAQPNVKFQPKPSIGKEEDMEEAKTRQEPQAKNKEKERDRKAQQERQEKLKTILENKKVHIELVDEYLKHLSKSKKAFNSDIKITTLRFAARIGSLDSEKQPNIDYDLLDKKYLVVPFLLGKDTEKPYGCFIVSNPSSVNRKGVSVTEKLRVLYLNNSTKSQDPKTTTLLNHILSFIATLKQERKKISRDSEILSSLLSQTQKIKPGSSQKLAFKKDLIQNVEPELPHLPPYFVLKDSSVLLMINIESFLSNPKTYILESKGESGFGRVYNQTEVIGKKRQEIYDVLRV